MTGEVGILSVGAGDTKLVFDPNSPEDMRRAAFIVKDMLKRGYSLLIEVPGENGGPTLYRRATDFDENTCEYIIASFNPETTKELALNVDDQHGVSASEEATSATDAETAGSPKTAKAGRKSRRFAASKTKAVAVARTAGG